MFTTVAQKAFMPLDSPDPVAPPPALPANAAARARKGVQAASRVHEELINDEMPVPPIPPIPPTLPTLPPTHSITGKKRARTDTAQGPPKKRRKMK